MLGRPDIDFASYPASALLEREDRELLHSMTGIIDSMRTKFATLDGDNKSAGFTEDILAESGPCTQILLVHAEMFEKASIWPRECHTLLDVRTELICPPVTKEIAQSLHVQASHIHAQALSSLKAES